MTEFLAIPSIAVVAYFVGLCIKSLVPSAKAEKFIPLACGLTGAVLAVVLFFTAPAIVPASDVVTAIAIGITSGLSATGVHQQIKQLTAKN